MANWNILKASIANVIKANNNQEITGAVLQNVLNSIVTSVGENATFAGIATPSTNPGAPDGRVFYFAYTSGTYPNFAGISLNLNEVAILSWNGVWKKDLVGLATQETVGAVLANTKYAECSSASNSATKVVSIEGFKLTAGCKLTLKMINGNTISNPTLNISNTGAKPLYYNGLVSNADNSWTPGELLNVVYDGSKYMAFNIKGTISKTNIIIDWISNVSATRKQIKNNERKPGLVITYKRLSDNTWINEQYIGTSIIDSDWANDKNWRLVPSIDVVERIYNESLYTIELINTNFEKLSKELETKISSNKQELETKISSNKQELETKISSNKQELETKINGKQDKLRQGVGIKIENNTLSSAITVVQSTGSSAVDVISQRAITNVIADLNAKIASQKNEVDMAKESAINSIVEKKEDAISDFSSQKVIPEMLSESVMQLIASGGGGIIHNAADDEDLCSTGENVQVLKLKDRPSNQSNYEKYGYKILRKNIVGTSNILAQDMISEPNTIYEIRYDFAINSNISIPQNCILRFNGGSISGSFEITGDATKIEALPVKIFSENIELNGSFDGVTVFSEWFGAKSLYSKTTASSESYNQKEVSIPTETFDLPDAAPAINKALQLSYMGGGEVEMLSRIYHIQTTVNIIFRSVLHTQNDTLFVVNMQGDATSKIVHSEEDATMSSVLSNTPYYTLARNEFFSTDSMAVAFNMHPVKTKFYGGGSITLYPSRYTIGIHIYSIGYWYMDMTYYTPIIDIVICGEKKNISSPDPRDLVGSGAPTAEIGSGNLEPIYYWDKDNKKYYVRNKNANWALLNGEADPHWNTCMRIEVKEGSSGGRIVNPHINCRMIYGARGLEIVMQDKSGNAWFNESWIEGSITEMYSNYISIYCEKNLSCDAHDWQKIVAQSSSKSMYDSCMFYAIRSGSIKLGHFWDVKWIGSRQKDNYYFGIQTTKIKHTWVDGSVKDLGTLNEWGQDAVEYDNKLPLLYGMWKNIWDKFLPSGTIYGGILDSAIEESSISNSILKNMINGQSPSPYIFDTDLTTCDRIIDTANNKYGFYLNCYNKYYGSIEKQTRNGYVLVIKYRFSGVKDTDVLTKKVKCRVFGERPTASLFSIDVALSKGRLNNQVGSEYVTETTQINIPYNNVRDLSILIYSSEELAGLALDLISLELYVNALGLEYAEQISNKVRPTAAPNGCIYMNNKAALINKGDAKNPIWVYLGEKYIDFDDLKVRKILAENYGDGENLVQSVAEYITTLGTLFKNNTDIKTFNELPKITGLKTVNESAFEGCTNLESIDLANVEVIKNYVFRNAKNLSYIGDTSNIKSIGSNSFVEVALESVSFPSLETLISATFNNSKIKRIENLGTITVIPKSGNYSGAFSNMTNLEFIRIPATCVEIQQDSFRESVSKLTMILEPIIPPTLASNWTISTHKPKAIYVPDESVNAYKTASVWSKYADIIKSILDE